MDQENNATESTEVKKTVPPPEPAPTPEEVQPTDEAKSTPQKKQSRAKKPKHKKTSKSKKIAKKQESSESSSSSSSSSSESDLSSSEDESDSSSDDDAVRKRKSKSKKAKLKKAKSKSLKKSRRRRAVRDEEDDSSDEDAEDDDTSAKVQALLEAQRIQKLQRQTTDDTPEDLAEYVARLRALSGVGRSRLQGRNRKQSLGSLSRRNLELEELRKVTEKQKQKKAKLTKKKRASKIAFKRVDQLWDSSIHNYKLTETVEDKDADEWDQYIFTVRRKFDWEHKYQETLVDVKSKPLRDALQHIMAGVKGVSLVAETPHVDPNMLFLYLEETRTYMNKLSEQSKSAKKKKDRKEAATKAQHSTLR